MAVVLSRYRAFSRWIRFQLMMQCSAAIVSIVLLRNDIIMLPSTRSVVLVFLNLPFQRRFNCDYFSIVISTRHSSLISCETLSKLVLSFAMRWICFTEIFAYETEEMAEEPEDLSELKFLPKTRKNKSNGLWSICCLTCLGSYNCESLKTITILHKGKIMSTKLFINFHVSFLAIDGKKQNNLNNLLSRSMPI